MPLSAGKPVFFFYLDGTLIETDHANNAAYVRSVEKVLGENISKMLDVNGPRITRTVVAQRLADYASGDEIRRIVRLKEEEYDNVICLTTPIEHVADILRSVKDDYVTVLVSNCREQRGLALLDYHNIRDCFTHLFFRQTDDTARNADNAGQSGKTIGIRRNKYANALSSLGIDGRRVIAFENELCEIVDAQTVGIVNINTPFMAKCS